MSRIKALFCAVLGTIVFMMVIVFAIACAITPCGLYFFANAEPLASGGWHLDKRYNGDFIALLVFGNVTGIAGLFIGIKTVSLFLPKEAEDE